MSARIPWRQVIRRARANQPRHMRLLASYVLILLAGTTGVAIVGRSADGKNDALAMERLANQHIATGDAITAAGLTAELHRLKPVFEPTPELVMRDVAVLNTFFLIPGYGGLLWLVIRMTRRSRKTAEPLKHLVARQVRYGLLAIAVSLDLLQNTMMVHAVSDQVHGLVQVGFLLDAVAATNVKWLAVGLATACAHGLGKTTRLGHIARVLCVIAGAGAVTVGLPTVAVNPAFGFPLLLLAWLLLVALCVQTAAAHPDPDADT